MNKRHRASSSSLFLMELILAILFFCIASTICISIFAKSHTMNREAGQLNRAVGEVANVCEMIYASTSEQNLEEMLYKTYNHIKKQEDMMVIMLDENFAPIKETTKGYELILKRSFSDSYLQATVSILDMETGKTIFSQDVKKSYLERTVAHE